MKKALHLIATLPKKLFYNKQTSVALAMALGATAALSSYASANPAVIRVAGTGMFEPKVECVKTSGRQAKVEMVNRTDSDTQVFHVIGSGKLDCLVTSGALKQPVVTKAGQDQEIDFSLVK